jgi:hypothetical protein
MDSGGLPTIGGASIRIYDWKRGRAFDMLLLVRVSSELPGPAKAYYFAALFLCADDNTAPL